jgi:hypothetical protein
MSYDIEVRRDAHYSSWVDSAALQAFIATLPDITVDDDIRLTYEVGSEYYMEIYLELLDQNGEWLEQEQQERGIASRVQMCIPYGYFSRSGIDRFRYFDIGFKIAQRFDWQVFDPQYDTVYNDVSDIRTRRYYNE